MKKVANFSGCKVYDLSTGKTMPSWLSENKKRALAKDEEYRKRLELIQDFEMPTAAQCIKMTRDMEHIVVTGVYSPLVRCYTVSDLAMKFQRGLTCDVVAFETLSDDYGKLVFLQSDRTLNFHAPYGTHYTLRIPKFGRDLMYSYDTCDLYISASGDEIYRLNLESGQFKEPLVVNSLGGCNKLHINPIIPQLLACGGEVGVCEFIDLRDKSIASRLNVSNHATNNGNIGISAIKFDTDGLTLGVGTSNGNCILYDIRSSKPLYIKEHQYGLPVIDVTFHNSSKRIISTDKKIVKIWDRDDRSLGKILTNIEPPSDINGLHLVQDRRGQSGLIMLAGEQSRVMNYFIPQLGPAPRWCSFLENLSEELEETSNQQVYEDYKFITKAELEELGGTGLIGTPLLRGYMHGFFIEMKLYTKLRAVSKPFEYDEHRKNKIKQKLEESRENRITIKKRLPKVNKALAEKLIKHNKSEDLEGKTGLIDDRFADLFKREEFEIDTNNVDYKLRNPSGSRSQKKGYHSDEDNLFNPVEEEGGGGGGADEDEYEKEDEEGSEDRFGGYDDYEDDLPRIRGGEEEGRKYKRKGRHAHDDEEDEGQIARASRLQASKSKSKKGPKMYEIADGVSAAAAVFSHTNEEKLARKKGKIIADTPLLHRVNQLPEQKVPANKPLREMSYIPASGKKDFLNTSGSDRREDDKFSKINRLAKERKVVRR